MSPATVGLAVLASLLATVIVADGVGLIGAGDASGAAGIVLGAVLVYWSAAGGLTPHLRLDEKGLVVVNPVFTYRVGWEGIAHARAANVLRLDLVGGRTIGAWAVQKSNLALMLGRAGRADDVAAQISALASPGGAAGLPRRTPSWTAVVTTLALLSVGVALGIGGLTLG